MNRPDLRRLAIMALFLVFAGGALAYFTQPGWLDTWSHTAAEKLAEGQQRSGSAAKQPKASPPSKMQGLPALDLARIEPDGNSLFAGRGLPGTRVRVEADGKAVGEASTDANGEWLLTTQHKFKSSNPEITVALAPAPTKVAIAAMTPRADASSKPAQDKQEAAPKPEDSSKEDAAGEQQRQIGAIKSLIDSARKQTREQQAEIEAEEQARVAKLASAQGKENAAREPTTEVKPAVPPAPLRVETVDPPPVPRTDRPKIADATPTQRRSGAGDSLPVPIKFIYGEAEFTPEGLRAAELLLEFLKVRKLADVVLTGHADEIGSNDYNLELSRKRLETVSNFLRARGYEGKLGLIAKGKAEPYRGVDRNRFSQEALHQLDRRVEIKLR